MGRNQLCVAYILLMGQIPENRRICSFAILYRVIIIARNAVRRNMKAAPGHFYRVLTLGQRG